MLLPQREKRPPAVDAPKAADNKATDDKKKDKKKRRRSPTPDDLPSPLGGGGDDPDKDSDSGAPKQPLDDLLLHQDRAHCDVATVQALDDRTAQIQQSLKPF
ncbi:hypothetical protein AK812_SmicGene3829 [Symbiodinium microadriaticum]|uniref:Uncharacterized protein n=1 Tax=Symbiodinium microadriaticum TaxID=2951 RepID=A0A1Q9EXU9_SYMMI|nr:hypothetical protein AK812_SmicGene3829 [Symbiodinium microadriaticum]